MIRRMGHLVAAVCYIELAKNVFDVEMRLKFCDCAIKELNCEKDRVKKLND